jgi:hypothetical protein
MMKQEGKPAWWKLEGVIILTMAALFLVGLNHLPPIAEKITDIFILFVAFWYMWRWCGANELGLEAEEIRRQMAAQVALSPETRPLNRQQLHFRRVMSKPAWAKMKRKMV